MTEPILTLEDQVPCYETCVKLAQSGFPQTTFFAWGTHLLDDELRIRIADWNNETAGSYVAPVAAPTFAELWAMLPKKLEKSSSTFWLYQRNNVIGYENERNRCHTCLAEDIGEGGAELWLHLHALEILPESAYADKTLA